MDKLRVKRIAESAVASAAFLKTVADKLFGPEWVDWDPTTVALELKDELSCSPSPEALDKMYATQIVMVGDDFFQRVDAFAPICNTLSGGSPSFSVFDPVTLPEAAWALTEVALMRDMLTFSTHVRSYVKLVLRVEDMEGDPPVMFDYVVARGENEIPDISDVIGEIREDNKRAIDSYLDDQLELMTSQFESADLEGELAAVIAGEGSL